MKKLSLVLLCFLISCQSENKLATQMKFEDFVEKNFDSYKTIYELTNLWLEESKLLKLENTKEIIFKPDSWADNLIIINKDKTKLVGTVNMLNTNWKSSSHDNVFMFWGVKVNNEWNFARGGSLHVPREYYKYNMYEPLTHFQLSYIGRDYFLKRFLNMDEDSISVKSELINEHVSLKGSIKFKNKDRVQNWKDYFEYKRSKIVSQEEIEDIWDSINNDKPVEKELPKKGTKEHVELYGKKIPLFEREEWKTFEVSRKKKLQ